MKFNLEQIAIKLYLLCAIPFLLFITANAFFYSQLDTSPVIEKLIEVQDHWICNALCVLVVLAIVVLLAKPITKLSERTLFIILIASTLIITLVGYIWLSSYDFEPYADQGLICYVAQLFEEGEYSTFSPWGYISACPHQLGQITFIRVLGRLIGEITYKSYQYVNLFMVPVFVVTGYYLIKLLQLNSKLSRVLFLSMVLTCFPMYGYIPFVYGEMASTTLTLVAVFCGVKFLKDKKLYWVAILSVLLGIAVQLRMNALIGVIAMFIVFIVRAFMNKSVKIILASMFMVVVVWSMQWAIGKLYEPHEYTEEYGVPIVSYIVMGMNDSENGPGWYDGYIMDVYQMQASMDVEESKRISTEDLKIKLSTFKNDPSYALDFYYRKFTSQWNAPLYLALPMTISNAEYTTGITKWVYVDGGNEVLEDVSNIHQLLVYLGMLVASVCMFIHTKKKETIDFYMLHIIVFGGALFSLIWEAKARYIFPYYMYMMIYGAIGIAMLAEIISKRRRL